MLLTVVDQCNGIISEPKLITNWCLPVEMEEEPHLFVKWLLSQISSSMEKLQALMFAVPIAKLAVISSKKLTRFLRTALISVNSHIDASKMEDRSSGRPSLNSKHTLSSTAPSLDVISAIDPSSSTWLEPNSTITSKETAQKFNACAKSATRSFQELSSTITSALRTSIWKDWTLSPSRSLTIWLISWFSTEDNKRVLACVWTLSASKSTDKVAL